MMGSSGQDGLKSEKRTDHRPAQRGLVLSGGGARGAYQAGVIKGVAEISASLKIDQPFRIVTGVSAGAVNATYLASRSENLLEASEKLVQSWSTIKAEDVFKTDAVTAGRLGFRFAFDAAVGALYNKKMARSLLDTSPLRGYLEKTTDFDAIARNLENGHIDALALTAMNYTDAHSYTFVQTHKPVPMWDRSRRKSVQAKIAVEHVMASGAIPIFFPPVKVVDDHFGDGCLRNTAPLSPAIHLGAERILVIGVRRPDSAIPQVREGIEPTLARVLGVVLNALLMDAVEFDMERLARINQTVDMIPSETRKHLQLRKIDFLWIRPSQDIGLIASRLYDRLPRVIRYLVSGLGSQREASELTSYLLFDPEFCSELVKLGYEDALAQRDALEKFLNH